MMMRKALTSGITILIIAAVVYFGYYAMIMKDKPVITYVEDVEYVYGGFSYSGGMKNGLFDGEGKIKFDHGGVFSGEFKDGRFNGHGEYTDAEGNIIYTGSFVNGEIDGYGKYISPEGWVYEGNFKEGLFDGEGSVTDGGQINDGIWKEGVQVKRND